MSTKIIFTVLSVATIIYIVSFFIWAEPIDPEITGAEETVAGAMTDEFEDTALPKNTVSDITPPPHTPANVPIYPDAYLNDSEEIVSDGVRDITLSLITSDTIADANTWYRSALKENGWTLVSDTTVDENVLIEGEKDDLKIFMQASDHTTQGEVNIIQRIRIQAQQ